MIVVAGGVGLNAVPHLSGNLRLHLVEIGLIRSKSQLLLVVETIETDILQGTAAIGRGEGVGHRGLVGDAAPLRLGPVGGTVDGHSALIELLAIAQHVLRHLTEVEVEIATVFGSLALLATVDEGVEHPELDVLDVVLLKVAVVDLAHHTAPMLRGIVERSVAVDVGIEVVRTTLVGVIRQVER